MLDFSKLRKIRPFSVERGNCLSCSVETANILKNDQTYEPIPITRSNANFSEVEALGEEVFKKAMRMTSASSLLREIRKRVSGYIYHVDTEDHAYVLFKSYNDNIYLLDSDAQIFKEIQDENDFKMPAGVMGEDEYNYFDVNESGFVTVYPIGRADSSWHSNANSMGQDVFKDEETPSPKSNFFRSKRGKARNPVNQPILADKKTPDKSAG